MFTKLKICVVRVCSVGQSMIFNLTSALKRFISINDYHVCQFDLEFT